MLDVQLMLLAVSRALFSAGSNIPARIAMMAITTRSSMSVKSLLLRGARLLLCEFIACLHDCFTLMYLLEMFLYVSLIIILSFLTDVNKQKKYLQKKLSLCNASLFAEDLEAE